MNDGRVVSKLYPLGELIKPKRLQSEHTKSQILTHSLALLPSPGQPWDFEDDANNANLPTQNPCELHLA